LRSADQLIEIEQLSGAKVKTRKRLDIPNSGMAMASQIHRRLRQGGVKNCAHCVDLIPDLSALCQIIGRKSLHIQMPDFCTLLIPNGCIQLASDNLP
jgi:hypothetical protein